jgi:hypothetical protein
MPKGLAFENCKANYCGTVSYGIVARQSRVLRRAQDVGDLIQVGYITHPRIHACIPNFFSR